MKTPFSATLLPVRLLACTLAPMVPLHATAADPSAVGPLLIRVFADHYELDTARLADLAALESSLRGSTRRTLRLDNCGPLPSQALLAAVDRLHASNRGVIEIHARAGDEGGCAAADDSSLRDAAYFATDARGLGLIP